MSSAELARLVGPEHVLDPPPRAYLHDATEAQGVAGRAEAVVRPGTPEEVAAVVAWCYEHNVPVTARGGGTGFAAGAVPEGGIVLALERLDRVRALEPGLWRMQAEAGLSTAHVRRRAREEGLLFPPDPGAEEQSLLGGNIATNAGGPHAFKYGVTGRWITGLEVVLAPGELVETGGPLRKEVAGYDLTHLLVGSEGTLGIVTAAWLRLVPAPEASIPVAAFYPDTAAGADAVLAVLAAGVQAAALDYLDAATLAAAGGGFPAPVPGGAGFLVLAEADGSHEEAAHVAGELREALEPGALAVVEPDPAALWRWRGGVSLAVTAQRGGKVSEDIVVPVERLAEAVDETVAIGRAAGIAACSWGHAGDGNLHATFMIDRSVEAEVAAATRAADALFDLALRLGGSLSGEHGLGRIKAHRLGDRTSLERERAIKRALDPKGLLNPGAKVPRL